MAGHLATTEPRHARRIFWIWLVLSLIATPLTVFVLGPHLPPGRMSNAAASQQVDMTVLFGMAVPVLLFIWTYFGYAVVKFRAPKGVIEDGPPIRGHQTFQTAWLAVSSLLVLALFAYGTIELVVPAGAGSGGGPSPIWVPAASKTPALQVQVIGQQWRFTFRYLNAGNFESTQLYLPVDRPVVFHVTSLDVTHSFWAYQLGVKADANPGTDNIAYATPTQQGAFEVRCSELCGIWHGSMYNTGHVVSASDFISWVSQEKQLHAADIPLLPPAAPFYNPGAGGGYYDPGQAPQPSTAPEPFHKELTTDITAHS